MENKLKFIKYDIYCGLSGGFGGATYSHTAEFLTADDAEAEARQLAIEEYQSYEGFHGILCWDEMKEMLEEDYGEVTDEEVDEAYLDEVEGWIEYYVKVHDPDNPPEE